MVESEKMKLEALRQHARVTPQFDHLLRYEGALNGRTLTQLDRLQRMRKGQALEGEAMEQAAAPELQKLALAPSASRRRQELLELLDRLNPSFEDWTSGLARTRAFTTPAHEATKVISQNEPNEYGERALHFAAGVGCGAVEVLDYFARIPRHFARGGRG